MLLWRRRKRLRIRPGDLYEDCSYATCLCLTAEPHGYSSGWRRWLGLWYDTDLMGLDLSDLSHRGCSARHCAPVLLTPDQAINRLLHSDHLLSALRHWVKQTRKYLRKGGWILTLDDSRASWEKASLLLRIEGTDRLGQLTLWDTGEAELECLIMATGETRRDRRELASLPDLHDALHELMSWLNVRRVT